MNVKRLNNYVKQIKCNLWLQIALYFNFYFFIIWIIFHFLTIFAKPDDSFDLSLFLKFTTLTILSIIEFPRIYLGYFGNLQSQILCCVGFFLLTLLIQAPIITFLLCSPLIKFTSFEIIMHLLLYLFHLIELVSGFILVKNLIVDII